VDKNHQWTDADKAQWILENGYPKIKYVYERVDTQVYRRPITSDPDNPVPPWINKTRTPIETNTTEDTW